jgi:hypothetical protein
VFGGLYLPHLREAIWRNLAQAERELRRGQELSVEVLDLDGDGHDEIWIHSDQFSALVSPHRGGAIEEYTIFDTETNYANSLTRRREAYHDTALENQAEATRDAANGAPSIHDLEEGIRLDQRPPLDADDRALLVDRVLPVGLPLASYADGRLRVRYRWDPSVGQADDLFATELSLFAPLDLRPEPAADVWAFPIETVAKSERGLDRTRQGDSVTLRWPAHLGKASIEISAPHEESAATERLGSGASSLSSP